MRARALFERGLTLAQDGRRAEAAEAFRASLELIPRASTALNLAIVLEELGRSREALLALDAVEADDSGASDHDRADAARLRATVAGQLATLTLTVQPPDARLEVDGRADGNTGPTRIVVMDPGPHVLRLSAEGHLTRELRIGAVAGAESMDVVRLESVTAPPTPAEVAARAVAMPDAPEARPQMEDSDPRNRRRRRLAGGISGAVAVVAAVVVAVVVARAPDNEPDTGSTGVLFEPFR